MNIKQIAKETGSTSLAVLETAGGFMAANAVSKVAKASSLLASFIIFIAGIGLAVAAPKMGGGYVFTKLLPSMGTGAATFGFIKSLNNLSSDSVNAGIKGLDGFSLPEPAKAFLKSWVPTLSGGASLSGLFNGTTVELVQLPDGSWGMNGLGNPDGLDFNLGNPISEYSEQPLVGFEQYM